MRRFIFPHLVTLASFTLLSLIASAPGIGRADGGAHAISGAQLDKTSVTAGSPLQVTGSMTATVSPVTGGMPTGLPGTSVSLSGSALAYGPDGDLYIADPDNNVIWKQTPDGTLSHVAGTGVLCLPDPKQCHQDGMKALDVAFQTVSGMAVAPDGDIFVSERDAHIVTRIDAQTGTISTYAGNGSPNFDESQAGGPATEGAIGWPGSLALDEEGDLFIAGIGVSRIFEVTPDDNLVGYAGCGEYVHPACDHTMTEGSSAQDTAIGLCAGINGNGWGLAVGPDDHLYLADCGVVARVDEAGGAPEFHIVVGTPFQYAESPDEPNAQPSKDAHIGVPAAMAFGPDGSLSYLEGAGSYSSPWNRVFRIDGPLGPDSVVHEIGGCCSGRGYSGDGGPATKAKFSFSEPIGSNWTGQGIAVGSDGTVDVGDVGNHRIRAIDPSGTITTVAGNGLATLVTHAVPILNGIYGASTGGLSGDGGPALRAQVYYPSDVVVDGEGNLYFLDTYNDRVRRIATDGTITTVAGAGCLTPQDYASCGPATDGDLATNVHFRSPTGIGIDRTGTQLYIVDDYPGRVYEMNLGRADYTAFPLSTSPVTIRPGHIATIIGVPRGSTNPVAVNAAAGGAVGVAFQDPQDVAADAAGNIYVADAGHNVIYRVDGSTGVARVIVGIPQYSNCDEDAQSGLPGNATLLCGPGSLTVANGSLYVAETGEMGALQSLQHGWVDSGYPEASRIRKVDLSSPIFTSTVIAGSGTPGFGGDGGPASSSQLGFPHGIAVAPDGTVYVADTGNSRVRAISPNGTITTIAGSGQMSYDAGSRAFSMDGCDQSSASGLADALRLCLPLGVALGPDGTLYVADSDNDRIVAIEGL
ncbi:MAG: hypothetical protein ABR600_05285 [Actinomycetota bacterium]